MCNTPSTQTPHSTLTSHKTESVYFQLRLVTRTITKLVYQKQTTRERATCNPDIIFLASSISFSKCSCCSNSCSSHEVSRQVVGLPGLQSLNNGESVSSIKWKEGVQFMVKKSEFPAESVHSPLLSQVQVTLLLNLSSLHYWTLHQVGLWDLKIWLWTQTQAHGSYTYCWGNISPSERLESNKISPLGVLVHIDFTINSLELAFPELDSARYKEGSCQMQWKQNSCWLFWRFSGETSTQYSFDYPIITDLLSHITLYDSHRKQTSKSIFALIV